MMEQTLRIFGPASAALHVFAQIALIFEVGMIGTAVKEYWLPFTRLVWSEIFVYLAFLEFKPTDAEKDALTAVAFFAPLAIVSAVLWTKDRKLAEEDAKRRGPLAGSIIRFAAFLASMAILFFVSQQLIADALSVYDVSKRELKSIEAFSMLSILSLGVIAIALTIFHRLDIELRKYFLFFGATIGALLELIIIGGPVIFAAYLAITELGFIRSGALLLVTFCVVLAISVRPEKVLQVAYVVVGLIAASWTFGLLQKIGESVGSMPR